ATLMQVSVRRATSDDATALAGLRLAPLAEGGAQTPEPEASTYVGFFTTWVDRNRSTHLPFVAVIGTDVVGAAWLVVGERVPSPERPYRRCGDVQSVYVLPEFSERGVGSALIKAALAEARRRGLEHVTVHSNDQAAPLYQRVGFRRDPNWLSWNP
ncbi:MAG: GNAT family N-acetyltransferase, partial [Pseudonocardia sp.]